ncbi:Ger(x)C family spore germination protein [Psychrobacillus insolitus]|nr:Ger(x)C family spore germination protein [Psychrobacillus insolitus]
MKKRILSLIILCLFLTGCWDKKELNELAITMALGVDKIDDEYLVSAQVVVPGEVSSMKGGAGQSPVTLFQAKGATMNDAIRNLALVSPRTGYFGHLQIVVIGESMAQEGIASILDYLSRYYEIRSDFYLLVAKETAAEKVLNIQTVLERIPANNIFNILHTSEHRLSNTRAVTLANLIVDLEREGKEGVLTGIYIIGDEESGSSKQNVESITPTAQLKLDGIAVFKEDKLVGWLTDEEGKAYNIITDKVKNTLGTLSCPEGGKVNVHVDSLTSKLKNTIVDGKPEIEIDIQISGNIGEIDCEIDVTKEETIKMLEKTYEEQVEKNVNETIQVVQNDFQSDIFGFGAAIHQSNPKEWKKIKNQWDTEFSEIKVTVKAKVNIRHFGTVNNPIQENIKD